MARIRDVGVDEVGRGPLAGPVTVCAFSVPRSFEMRLLLGITDSKQLSRKEREEWSKKLYKYRKEGRLDFRICSISSREIDRLGIAQVIRKALNRSIYNLDLDNRSHIYLDGTLRAPKRFKKQKTIVGGDGKNKLISAASVIAKVHRDSLMRKLSDKYPEYGFDSNVGYGTKMHKGSIKKYGITSEHRKTFIHI